MAARERESPDPVISADPDSPPTRGPASAGARGRLRPAATLARFVLNSRGMSADAMATLHWEDPCCFLCGGREATLLFEHGDLLGLVDGQFRVVQCPQCTTVYCTPRPRPEDLASFYPSDYFQLYPQIEPGRPVKNAFNRLLLSAWDGSKVRRLRRPIRSHLGDAFSALDYGCAQGNFAYLLRRAFPGASVVGTDVGLPAGLCERNALDVEIRALDVIQASNERFDLVTAWHVLEHHPDPLQALEEWRGLLSARGILAVEVPVRGNLWERLFGPLWRGWELPRHLHHFDAAVLHTAFARAGLEVVETIHPRISTAGFMLAPLAIQSRARLVREWIYPLLAGLMSYAFLPLDALLARKRLGDQVLFVLRSREKGDRVTGR